MLAVIEHGSRRIRILGATGHSCESWVAQHHLLRALREFERFYNGHRPHQGIANACPLRPLPPPITDLDQIAHLDIRRCERLGGILLEYEHAA